MSRKGIEKVWPLPSPEVEPYREYLPIVRATHLGVPFGYQEDPEDPSILLPIPEELEALDKAKEFLKKYSYRAVAYWLSRETEKYISPRGLKERIDREKRYKSTASIYEYYAKRYKEAMEKAEKYKGRVGGERTYRDVDPRDSQAR